MPKAGKEHGVGSCKRCGDECGCAGGVKAGACGAGCQAGGCKCAHRVDPDPEVKPLRRQPGRRRMCAVTCWNSPACHTFTMARAATKFHRKRAMASACHVIELKGMGLHLFWLWTPG